MEEEEEEEQQSCYESILGAYRKRFGNPGGLETRKPRGLEARRLWVLTT